MKEGRVSFRCGEGKGLASLAIDGFLVVEGVTVPEMAQRLRASGVDLVTLADGFTFPIPTDATVLSAASVAQLEQPFETFYLIAECSWSE